MAISSKSVVAPSWVDEAKHLFESAESVDALQRAKLESSRSQMDIAASRAKTAQFMLDMVKTQFTQGVIHDRGIANGRIDCYAKRVKKSHECRR
ncbi:hypothetical protein ACHAWF_000498 [Thalassiosira exigua]